MRSEFGTLENNEYTGSPEKSSTEIGAEGVARTTMQNLMDQHDWTQLELSHHDGLTTPLISGLPPRLLYLHPDEQLAQLETERTSGQKPSNNPVIEWILPTKLEEKWTLARFAAVFDKLPARTNANGKRLVLATLHNDSTVVYYLIHEGMVKPRQN